MSNEKNSSWKAKKIRLRIYTYLSAKAIETINEYAEQEQREVAYVIARALEAAFGLGTGGRNAKE